MGGTREGGMASNCFVAQFHWQSFLQSASLIDVQGPLVASATYAHNAMYGVPASACKARCRRLA